MLSTERLAFHLIVAGFCGALFSFPTIAMAGDRRVVTEPVLPKVICTELAPIPDLPNGPQDGGDQKRIQAALSACPAGAAVRLEADANKDRFVSGPLTIPAGVALWIDKGATLAATTDPRAYDRGKGRCGTIGPKGNGCAPFIAMENASHASLVGDGEIDGQGDKLIEGKRETWWQLARRAQAENGSQNAPRLIQVNGGEDVTFYRLALRNAANFHLFLNGVRGATIWGIRINTPASARNTDGIDPASSTDVTIAESYISTGDDNIAIKGGSAGPTAHVTIVGNHLYAGHGMSIGSETQSGVSDVLITDMTLDGTTNGLRIKSDRSRGGLVRNIDFENVCLRNTRAPLVLDTTYDATATGMLLPVYSSITLRNIQGTGGPLVVRGVDALHSVGLLLDNVNFGDASHWQVTNAAPLVAKGGVTPAVPGIAAAAASGIDCSGRWVPFPSTQVQPLQPLQQPIERAPPAETIRRASTLTVGPAATFPTIQLAVDAARPGDTVRILPGTYREVVHLRQPDLLLEGTGSSPADVVVIYNHVASASGGTHNTATVFAEGDGDRLRNMTIVNSYHQEHPDRTSDIQAVALYASGDLQTFQDLHLVSYQDTLYAGSRGCDASGKCAPARQLYDNVEIDGAVDVIFGDAKAYFDHAHLHGLARPAVTLTAQRRARLDQDSSFVFSNCDVTTDPSVRIVSLGRPWGAYATVAFIGCHIDAPVLPHRFTEWPGTKRLTTTAIFSEDGSAVSGAGLSEHEPNERLLCPQEAARLSTAIGYFGSPAIPTTVNCR